MVKGLEKFSEYFRDFADRYVIIGGTACDVWFQSFYRPFSRTKDIDVVLVAEKLDREFRARLREFEKAGRYESPQHASGNGRTFYRYFKPGEPDFPAQIEIFCRDGSPSMQSGKKKTAPLLIGGQPASLSAILMDDDYFNMVCAHVQTRKELSIADVDALIALKVKAYLNIRDEQFGSSNVSSDATKHRNDVFRLTYLITESPLEEFPDSILQDIRQFVEIIVSDSTQWQAISDSVKRTAREMGAPDIGQLCKILNGRF